MLELIEQFEKRFGSSEECYAFLFQIKWPGGFECPICSHKHCYVISTRRLPLYECRACRHQSSLTAGTIMEKSRTSLRKWMLALFLFTHPLVEGLNAVKLAECLNVTYKTAWSMLGKIRRAVSRIDDCQPLNGNVDVIVAAYCRPLIGSLLPHPKETPVVVGANLDETGSEASAVKMKIADPSMLRASNACFLFPEGEHWFASCCAAEDAEIRYIHQPIRHRPQSLTLRMLAKQAQKWAARIYRGISGRHLQSYLDEFCFRYNYRTQGISAESAFLTLSQASVGLIDGAANKTTLVA